MLLPRSLDTTYHSEMFVSMLLQRKLHNNTEKTIRSKKQYHLWPYPTKQKWTNLSVIITFWASLAKYHFHHEWQWLLLAPVAAQAPAQTRTKDWMQTLPCEHHLQSTYSTITPHWLHQFSEFLEVRQNLLKCLRKQLDKNLHPEFLSHFQKAMWTLTNELC